MSSTHNLRLFVTGSTGQLGQLVVDALLRSVPASQIIAGVRHVESEGAQRLRARGVEVRVADYSRPDTLSTAFAGVDRLLLISSNELGQREAQHRSVINAAKQAGVGLIAYTSVLRADTSPLNLATEHRLTETALRTSGAPFVLLRNGFYNENYSPSIPAAQANGAVIGCAGEGRISTATRADYADAAAIVLTTTEDQAGRIYELAGDEAFTMSEFAAAIAAASGKPVAYHNMSQADHQAALLGTGMPDQFAALLADIDASAAKGALFDDGRQLSALIGRPTTPMPETVAAIVNGSI